MLAPERLKWMESKTRPSLYLSTCYALLQISVVRLSVNPSIRLSMITYDRRAFMGYFASLGLGSTLFPGVLWAKISAGADITIATIASAEEVAGIHFDACGRAVRHACMAN